MIVGHGETQPARIIDLPVDRGPRGDIVFVESARHLPFAFTRIYYFYDMPSGESRGHHAHRNCETFLIAGRGSFRVLLDDGHERVTHVLSRPDQGLLVPRMVWLEVSDLTPESLCLVLASEYYEAEDHVSDYQQFLREVMNRE